MSSQELELIPEEVIRTETTLTKFPIHQLSKGQKIKIDFQTFSKNGKLETRWKVRNPPNSLAYKIDTLVINRRIEEQTKPLPKLIKLGSLREIARELGLKTETNKIKEALLQNAGALINAKFTYKNKEGEEKYIEIADTRYAVIFVGEKLPTGDKAESTYIYLHDIYKQILDSSKTRPLDYDYLKKLTPMTQRFYELMSFKLFRAIPKNGFAELYYSEFCRNAPQTRFYDWEQVRPQMYRVHKPHLANEYIELVKVETIRDEQNKLDWIFVYKAGRKAKGEHILATRTEIPKIKKIKGNPDQLKLGFQNKDEIKPEIELTFTEDEEAIISKMRVFKVSEKKARVLIKSHREAVEREILAFPYRLLGEDVKNPSGLFIKAVEEGYEPPESYLKSLEQAEAKKRFQAETKKHDREAKAKREEQKIWERASSRLANLPEAERSALFESTKKRIIEVDYKDADAPTLKVLESVIEGYTRAAIIEQFIAEELETKS